MASAACCALKLVGFCRVGCPPPTLTGWRVPTEVLTLKWARIDREAETIRLEPGEAKNREGRTFPYGFLPELRGVVEAQWRSTSGC